MKKQPDAFEKWVEAMKAWINNDDRPNQFLEPDKPQPPIPRLADFK